MSPEIVKILCIFVCLCFDHSFVQIFDVTLEEEEVEKEEEEEEEKEEKARNK